MKTQNSVWSMERNIYKMDTHQTAVICVSEKRSAYLVRLIFKTIAYLDLTLA